jgi:hypothetical protein
MTSTRLKGDRGPGRNDQSTRDRHHFELPCDESRATNFDALGHRCRRAEQTIVFISLILDRERYRDLESYPASALIRLRRRRGRALAMGTRGVHDARWPGGSKTHQD